MTCNCSNGLVAAAAVLNMLHAVAVTRIDVFGFNAGSFGCNLEEKGPRQTPNLTGSGEGLVVLV